MVSPFEKPSALSFFRPFRIPVNKKVATTIAPTLLQYNHQSYCWQVALQQSLLPLQIDKRIKAILLKKIPTIFDHITYKLSMHS